MKVGEQIFRLIRSMRKDEKRYFKWYTSRYLKDKPKATQVLFDIINKLETYEEEVVQEAAIENQINHLQNVKQRLKKEILHTLTDLSYNRSDRVNAFDLYQKSEIALKRNLPNVVEELVNKGKANYNPKENPMESYFLNTRLLTCLVRWSANTRQTEVEKTIEEMYQNLKDEENVLRYLELSSHFWNWYLGLKHPNSDRKMEEILPLVNSKWFQDESLPVSVTSKRSLFFCKHLYFTIIEDNEKGIEYMQKMVSLYEEYPWFAIKKINLYVVDIFNLLATYTDIFYLEQAKVILDKFILFGKESLKPKDKAFTEYQFHRILAEAYYHHQADEHEKVLLLIPDMELYYFGDNCKFMPYNLLFIYFFVINSFFSLEKYEETLKWISLFYQVDFQDNTPRVQFAVRLIEVAIYYKMDHWNLCQSLIQRAKYFANTKNVTGDFSSKILKAMQVLLKVDNRKKTKAIKELRKDLTSFFKENYIRHIAIFVNNELEILQNKKI